MMRSLKSGNVSRWASVFAMLALSSTSACNYNDLKNPSSNSRPRTESPTGASPDAAVDFETVRRVVFEPACLKCHGEVSPKGGVRLDTYALAFSAAQTVRAVVGSGEMPPPPPRGATLSPEQKALLFAWIDSGAPETTVVPAPIDEIGSKEPAPPSTTPPPHDIEVPEVGDPVTETPDFAFVLQNVYVPHCLKCHSADERKGGVDLETYTEAVKNSFATANALDIDDMPRRAPPLTPELKKIVYDWIAGGTPEFNP